MGSMESDHKPHAVCIPFPAQGHITPMLKVAKLLHSFHGFHITFVNTEYNHRRLLRSQGPAALDGLPDFRFATIPDGLPYSDEDRMQDVPSLCRSTTTNCLPHFRKLLAELNDPSSDPPKVTCVVSDAVMSFTLDAVKELGIPDVLFWTASAIGYIGYRYCRHLMEKGIVPLKDVGQLTDGHLETPIDWVPGAPNMRLRDFPSFIRTQDPDDFMVYFVLHETERTPMASAVLLNTFDDFERPVLEAMAAILPPIYTIGPLPLLARRIPHGPLSSVGSSLWKEEPACLQWLENKRPGSVVYVNFGSVTVMTNQQLIEFAWGLANSKYEFLWIIRPDLVKGDTAVLPPEFVEGMKERGLMASWCPQEEVLRHPAVGAFLTHSGWNSTLESVCGGVPMLSWPFFAEQQTNCRYTCAEWGIGMEIDGDVKRKEVEGLIREIMGGEKGKEMKRRAMEWKDMAAKAAQEGGPSFANFDKLVGQVLLSKKDVVYDSKLNYYS
ncbi:7-deoxyloganetin glucosyltransferase-like [Ananas comosus]|uniref:Glycosyltransferase n=1 Tax=Ananas comosus TaxID=4615 RepID=A0A6P5F1D7_ANACO|nr:7-deoxyloganetin glucosyltransferase-like [Ananas comosus]